MKVIKASILGYCMGVRRAVTIAKDASQAKKSSRIYTMGPLIHNPQVLEGLRKQEMEVLDELNLPGNLQNAVIIIRAHGITPALEAVLAGQGARLIDATCPNVKASQMKVKTLTAAGYWVFLAGDKQHGELIGIQGYAPDCLMVTEPQEARETAQKLYREVPTVKTALLGQTTISFEEYRLIGEEIQYYFPDLEIINTICGATRDRQKALKELCGQVDALVIAGGRESANTRRLLTIAKTRSKPAWLVESPEDIPLEVGSYGAVGLSAGASTPDDLIEKIENELYHLAWSNPKTEP